MAAASTSNAESTDATEMSQKITHMIDQASWSWTFSHEISLNHTWLVCSLSKCLSMERTLETSVFGTEGILDTKWKMTLTKRESSSIITLYCNLIEAARPVKAGFKFILFNKMGVRSHVIVGRDRWFRPGDYGTNYSAFKEFSQKNCDDSGRLPDDLLYVTCVIHIQNLLKKEGGKFVANKLPLCTMSQDYNELFKQGHFYDATIEVPGGKVFPVHKAILTARSPVFAAMFSHQMVETRENRVRITDIREDLVEKILTFLYTGKVTDLNSTAAELLPVADRYGIEQLKIMCEIVLTNHLTIDNVAGMLLLAYRHCILSFKVTTVNFIVKNFAAVSQTQDWIDITQQHPDIMHEVLRLCFNPGEASLTPIERFILPHFENNV